MKNIANAAFFRMISGLLWECIPPFPAYNRQDLLASIVTHCELLLMSRCGFQGRTGQDREKLKL